MKKNTLLLFAILAFVFSANAQFGCASGVVITDGYTASGITTPGTAGAEDWNSPNPTDGCGSNTSYWDDDVYLFTYTAGATDESISMSILSRSSWNGIGIFSTCTGTALDGCINTDAATGADVAKTVTATIASGQTVYIGVGQWGTPNNLDFDVTDFTVTPIVTPPNCTTLSAPLNAATDVSEEANLTWNAATGSPTGYFLSVGTTMGGTEIVNNFDNGASTTYDLPLLMFSATYYVTITPYNGNGSATGCTEESFTTRATPPVGEICGNPIVVSALPYNTTDDTATYGDDYNGSAGASCGSTSGYLNGDDVVYSYTPTADASITILLSGLSDTYAGVFMYDGCSNLGVTCLNGGVNAGSSADITFTQAVTANVQYVFVISTWANPQTVAYTLDITEDTCTNPTATYTPQEDCGNDQFTVDVEITDMGTATSLTISDDQGSATQVANSAMVYSFGPYPSGTTVNFNIINDQDATCFINSGAIEYICPPANNDCSAAEAITVTPSGAIVWTSGTTSGNTASGETPAPTCSSFGNMRDVWYSATVPSDGNLTIETRASTGSSLTDTGMAVYSGTCGAFTQISCDDDAGTGNFSLINLTGLNDGDVIYIRVFEYANAATRLGPDDGPFEIAAHSASLGIDTFIKDELDFSFYPNPVESNLNISTKTEITSVVVYNLLGQSVIDLSPNAIKTTVDMSALANGAYFVKVISGSATKTIRILKN